MSTPAFFKRSGAPPKPYKDLGKSANDLLKKGFPSEDKFDWKVELNNSPSSTEHGTFTGVLTKKKGGVTPPFEGDVSYKLPVGLAEFTGKWDISNNFELKGNRKNLMKGFDVNTEFKLGPKGLSDSNVKVGGDFKKELVNTSVNANYKVSTKEVSADLTAVFGSPDAAFGIEAKLSSVERAELRTINATAVYSPSDKNEFTVTVKRDNATPKEKSQKTILQATFFQKLPRPTMNNLTLAGEITYDLSAVGPDNIPAITVGGSYTPDNESDLKARLNSKGIFGMSLNQRIGNHLTATAAVDVPLSAPDQFIPALKFVFSL